MAPRDSSGSRPPPRAALPAPPARVDRREDDPRTPGGKPPRRGPARAVALEYRPDRGDDRPRITASGQGAVAEQILQCAFAHGVKVRQDADLVEILSLFEPDSPIPLEALAAVAEILAYVYQAEGRQPPGPAAGPAPAAAAAPGAPPRGRP